MRYAIIRGGIVENLTEWDGDTKTWQPPEGSTAEPFPDGPGSIGWEWNDGKPVDPNPPLVQEPPPELTSKEKLEAALGIPVAELKALLASEG